MTDTLAADVRVDVTSIEKQLADLWRAEKGEGEGAVTRAALWNMIAHTWSSQEHARATQVLALASAAVPQRTIVVQADPDGSAEIESWISANCHLVGGGRQVCSEEVVIRAAGERVHHVPPLVKALLLPDMPVAVWWVGDLPRDHHDYAETLLEPADRLIVDSAQFNGADDLELVSRIAEQTTTAPADLNWARLEEWRAATASLFDPAPMRERLAAIRSLRVTSGGDGSFGATAGALLYVAWMSAQLKADIAFELVSAGEAAGIASVEIEFNDGTKGMIQREASRGVVVAHSDATPAAQLDCIARVLASDTEDLIVRLLKRPEADKVYLKTLKIARRLAA
ncbi:MAG TPA: glucose-6-phosphate dehydrogenase assembly protein OpcA [Thermoanaerobaculia bacterium]|nr:glucose-6-phosphate dehydrogenase assembly protein OpcA [Thermoanaerobaculia bacterium]